MNSRITHFTGIALMILQVFAGCKTNAPQAKIQDGKMAKISNTDSLALSRKISLPSGYQNLKWLEVSRQNGRSDLGPTDTRLHVVFELDDSVWTELVKEGLPPTKRKDLPLKNQIAEELFSSEDLSQMESSAAYFTYYGDIFNPDTLASSWYQGVAAAKIGGKVYLEFVSK